MDFLTCVGRSSPCCSCACRRVRSPFPILLRHQRIRPMTGTFTPISRITVWSVTVRHPTTERLRTSGWTSTPMRRIFSALAPWLSPCVTTRSTRNPTRCRPAMVWDRTGSSCSSTGSRMGLLKTSPPRGYAEDHNLLRTSRNWHEPSGWIHRPICRRNRVIGVKV
jgi:hypothetical protein